MNEIDLYGDGCLTAVVSHQEVEATFPSTVDTFKRINSLTKKVLCDAGEYPHDKATVELGPLRSRTLLGATERSVVSRIFTANSRNLKLDRRYATNIVILWNRETGHPYCIMDGNPIYDFRTASTAAVGVECLGVSEDSVVCVLGAGPVGKAAVLALGALQDPPYEIRMTAKRKMGFKTLKERLNTFFETFDPAITNKTKLVACETLQESILGSTVIIDAISLRTESPLINERLFRPGSMDRTTYVDVGKQALSGSLVPKFSAYVFDNLDIGYRLDSPASKALREGRCNVTAKKCDIPQLLNREIDFREISPPILLTVMGVASVDAKIAEDGFERFRQYSSKSKNFSYNASQ
jgi:ornithine cyclodeaminase/alanine dehydrogenase-like protein (mu-crystallin family)